MTQGKSEGLTPLTKLYETQGGIVKEAQVDRYGNHVIALSNLPKLEAVDRDFIYDFVKFTIGINKRYLAALKKIEELSEQKQHGTTSSDSSESNHAGNNNVNETFINSDAARVANHPTNNELPSNFELPEVRTWDQLIERDTPTAPVLRELSSQPAQGTMDRRIRLNELVTRPDTFDGMRPMPQKWLDKYKNAIRNNDWSDRQAVNYFSGFLTRAADDWYETEVAPNIDDSTTFDEIERLFVRNFIGAASKESLLQLIDKTRQGYNEPVAVFIPKIRRLLLLSNPTMPTDQQITQIKHKLKPEFKQLLALFHPITVEELRDHCVDIEAGLPNAADIHNNRRPRGKQERNNNNSGKEEHAQRNTGSLRKCYKCSRLGHISTECKATSKADGSKLNERTESKTKPQHQNTRQTVRKVESTGFEENRNAPVSVCSVRQTIPKTRVEVSARNSKSRVDWNELNKVNNVTTRGLSSRLIEAKMNINNIEVQSIVDTGCYITIVDAGVVKKNGWKIDGPSPSLVGADGNGLRAIGTLQAKLSVTLGKITKQTIHRIAVVENLTTPALLGLELLDALNITIETRARKLSYASEPKNTGVRVKGNQVVPPRAQSIVVAAVSCDGPVLVTPSEFDQKVLVANAIAEVEDGTIPVLVANNSNSAVELKDSQCIALYEAIDKQSSGQPVNRIYEIEGFDDTINIGDDLPEDKIQDILALVAQFKDAFSINGELGKTNLIEHEIELVDGTKPFVEPMRRRALAHVEETRRQVKEMLEQGIIEESKSPWASAYVLAPKKNGEHRLCVDFRRLNAATKKAVFPLPNIDDCLDTLCGKRYFSQVDFASGFWQVPMAKASRELTAFRTEDNQYQFKRMPFGLTNAPASFQKLINALVTGLKGLNLQAFIDDICIATDTWTEHLAMLQRLFELVIEAKLKLKGTKCTFGASRVTFLGHEISEHGIRQEQSKLRAILNLEPPKDVKAVRRVLGLLSYYRKFVPKFSILAAPLTELTKKKVPFKWEEKQQQAFRNLIDELAKNATLSHFDHKKPTMVKTDASHSGIAGLLLQKHDETWKIVACCSRRLSASELNYGITDLEGLAIIYTVTKFRHFLLGKPFEILTDHCALCVLNKRTPTSPRLKRWAIVMSEYDFKITYTKGNLHEDIDCLSRAPVNDPNDNFLDDKVYHIAAPTNLARWTTAYNNDESKMLLEKARDNLEGFRLVNGFIYYVDRLYVPEEMRPAMLFENHDLPAAGHGGHLATEVRMHLLWWPSMRADIKKYVESCKTCQARKAERAKPVGSMESFEVTEPLECIAIDCMGPISSTLKKNQHIIVAVDMFTRFVEARAVESVNAATFADFLSDFCGRYGIPKAILTDNASTFCNAMVKEVNRVFGITHIKSTPQHSRGNAIAERAIQSLQEKLGLITNSPESSKEWDIALPVAVLSLNTSINKSTGYSPYELTFGNRSSNNSTNTTTKTTVYDLHAQVLNKKLEELRIDSITNQSHARSQAKPFFDARHRPRAHKIGDQVMIKAAGRRAKLSNRFIGPYEVISAEKDIYKVRSFETGQVFDRHASHMKPFKSTTATVNLVMLISLLSLLTNVASSRVFNRKEPAFYEYTTYIVDENRENYMIGVKFSSPCPFLTEAVTGALNIEELQKEAHQCELQYQSYIVSTLRDMEKWSNKLEQRRNQLARRLNRSKRFVPAFMAGFFVSNMLSTVVNRIFSSNDDEKIMKDLIQTQKATRGLSDRLKAVEMMNAAVAEAMKSLERMIYETNTKLNQLEQVIPELTVLSNYLLTKTATKAGALHRLFFGLQRIRVDLEALYEILEAEWPEDIDEDTIQFIGFSANATQQAFTIKFSARKRATSVFVLKLQTFKHWTNFTGTPALVEYRGDQNLIYNMTSDCVRGISEPKTRNIIDRCDTMNYADDKLSRWEVVSTDLDEYVPTTTVKQSWPGDLIYCYGLNITIANETMECPPYVFDLGEGVEWNTSDHKHTPNERTFDYAFPAPALHPIHTRRDEMKTNESSMIRRIMELNLEISRLDHEEIKISIPLTKNSISLKTLIFALVTIGLTLWKIVPAMILARAIKDQRRKALANFKAEGSPC